MNSLREKELAGQGREPLPARLQLGCANIAPPGWTNLDGSWNAWLAGHPFLRRIITVFRVIPAVQLDITWPGNILVHDVRRGLPFSDGSFYAIYASHLLEHLYFEEAHQLLQECFRVLQPGGLLRLVVPDLHTLVQEYLKDLNSGDLSQDCPADRLCRRLDMRPPQQRRVHFLYRLYSSVKDFHTHKWMYDAESLRQHLYDAGFVNISQKSFLESEIPGIEEVEREDRFGGSSGICLEGIKPFAE